MQTILFGSGALQIECIIPPLGGIHKPRWQNFGKPVALVSNKIDLDMDEICYLKVL